MVNFKNINKPKTKKTRNQHDKTSSIHFTILLSYSEVFANLGSGQKRSFSERSDYYSKHLMSRQAQVKKERTEIPNI